MKPATSPHIDALQTLGPAYNILIERNSINLSTESDFINGHVLTSFPADADLTVRYNVITAYRGLNIQYHDKNRRGADIPNGC
jgi:hypothetical protein